MEIRELTAIGSLHSLRLLAGEKGLARQMKDVVLLEYESLRQEQPDYYREDFIISTLFFAKDDPDELLRVLQRLIDLGAEGMAVKSVYFPSLPKAVLELADRHHFPIFMFDDLYLEDVIIAITEYIRLRQEFATFQSELLLLLEGTIAPSEEQQLLLRMNPSRRKYTLCLYTQAATPGYDWVGTVQNILQFRGSRELTTQYRFLQFRHGIFILCNFTEDADAAEIAAQCFDALTPLGCCRERLLIGVSSIHAAPEAFGRLFREAFDAATSAKAENALLRHFSHCGVHRFIYPLLRDNGAIPAYEALMGTLSLHDSHSGGALTETLAAYARSGYDLNATATQLSQHVNTIRYRMKKIAELWNMSPAEAEHQMFLLGEFTKLKKIRQQML